MSAPTPGKGQVWQSRDEKYEPGRRVRVDGVRGNRVAVTTVAHPRRPERIGKSASFQVTNLQRKWQLVLSPVATAPSSQDERNDR